MSSTTASRPLAGRYTFVQRIRGTQRTIIWIARDQATGRSVLASVLPAPRAAALEPAIGIEHVHAATVLAVIESPLAEEIPDDGRLDVDARVVVATYLEGGSLQQRLDAGPISVENAVDWATTVADALSLLHEHAAVHGAISPRSILVIRPDRAVVPTLVHLLVPPSGAYCSPERVTGAGPSEADDTWALAATLYTALSRRAPFRGETRTELARAIVRGAPEPLSNVDPDLWAIIERALSPEPKRRLGAAGFRDALRGWMDETGAQSLGDFVPVEALRGTADAQQNVGDLSLVAALARPDSAEATAPLDARSLRPTPADRAEPSGFDDLAKESKPAMNATNASGPPHAVVTNGERGPRVGLWRRSRLAVVALIGVAGAASAGVGLLAGRLRNVEVTAAREAPPARRAHVPETFAPPKDTSTGELAPGGASSATEPSATAAVRAAPAPLPASEPGKPNACVARTFPVFKPDAELGFLCAGTDLWSVTRQMDLQVAKHGEGPGFSTWAHLGRFDLAATAVLRGRCCPDAAEFTAATPPRLCEALPASLHDLAKNPSPSHADDYTTSVDCLLSHKVRYPAEWWDRVGVKEARTYFDAFLTRVEQPH